MMVIIIVKLSIITVKNMLIQYVFCLSSSTLLLVGANFVDIPTFDTNQVTIQNIENESLNFQCISSRSYNEGNNNFLDRKTIRVIILTFIRVEDNIRGSIITAKKTYKVDGALNNPIRLNDLGPSHAVVAVLIIKSLKIRRPLRIPWEKIRRRPN